MRISLLFLLFCLTVPGHVTAQEERPRLQIERDDDARDDESKPLDDAPADAGLVLDLDTGPDYSDLTPKAEQNARLDALFLRLKDADEENGKLIAEEIWAIWLDSGSPSVNMILLRGTAFENQDDYPKARRMYDHVTTLLPEYAEGWARSARLAYLEEDYNRALVESAQALIYEPREFYALWTIGNVLEKLDRNDEAFEAYQEVLKLYPEHPAIKSRVKELQGQIDGEVL